LCEAVGLPDLVSESVEAYGARLRALCADRALLRHYREHLARGRATLPLFDTPAFTRHFERLLESVA
ncbi:MAG: hypothetical protein ABW276_01970, partial [Casimicrobiaceae bacterium]